MTRCSNYGSYHYNCTKYLTYPSAHVCVYEDCILYICDYCFNKISSLCYFHFKNQEHTICFDNKNDNSSNNNNINSNINCNNNDNNNISSIFKKKLII